MGQIFNIKRNEIPMYGYRNYEKMGLNSTTLLPNNKSFNIAMKN